MELFKLLGKIAVDDTEAKKALGETSEKGKEAESKLKSAFGKIGGYALELGKVIVKGMAAGSVAVAGLTKTAIAQYADYEQLVGGMEALFGEAAANKIIGSAQQAYKTAGMSANEYMQTVTMFSASLIKGLGGDTVEAARIADIAITDMSDNVNRFGTDVAMVQNAYQGFAKANFTMLDNLSLGYAGTQQGMVDLINDSHILESTITSLDGITFDQMIMAIHKIQEEMNITGTTANEAASTLQGSSAMMKASWKNLMVAMADDTLNFDMFLNDFIESVGTYGKNLLPRIKIVLNGVVQLVSALAPRIATVLPGIFNDLLPAVIAAATGLLTALASALPGLISSIVNVLPALLDGIYQIGNALIAALPAVIDGIIAFISNPAAVGSLLQSALKLFTALVDAVPVITDKIITAAPAIIKGLALGIISALPALLTAMKSVANSGVASLNDGLHTALSITLSVVSAMWDAIKAAIANKIKEMAASVTSTFNSMRSTISSVINGIKSAITSGLNAAKSAASSAANGIKSAITSALNAAKSTVSNIVNSIKNTVKNIFNGIKPKLNLSLPKVTVSGGSAPWGIGGKGSLPHFNVTWNKLGAIFDQPTIFNTPLGYQGVGEAGPEAVAPIDTLMNYVSAAVNTSDIADRLSKLEDVMMMYLPQIAQNARHEIVLDSGTLVGSTVAMYDSALGKRARKAGR